MLPDDLCSICGARAHFGFGLPPAPVKWACAGHRAITEALWRPEPYIPLPRTGAPRRVPPSPAARAVRKLTR